MSDKPRFRPGVGIILYHADDSIVAFQRTDNSALWQFPQGGMDANESYEDTLWRELYEETAMTEDMIESVTPYPDWTLYEYPPHLRAEMGNVLGQVHRWYFLKIQPGQRPSLETAADKEFANWQTMTMVDFLTLPSHDFKLPVYHQLAAFYLKFVV